MFPPLLVVNLPAVISSKLQTLTICTYCSGAPYNKPVMKKIAVPSVAASQNMKCGLNSIIGALVGCLNTAVSL